MKLFRELKSAIEFLQHSFDHQHTIQHSNSRTHIELFQQLFQRVSSIEFVKSTLTSLRDQDLILEFLTVSFLQKMKNFEQLSLSLLHSSHNRRSTQPTPQLQQQQHKANLDQKAHFLGIQFSQLCHALGAISDLLRSLSQVIGIEKGISFFELLFESDQTSKQLNHYMNHQRVHTCHNYILSYGNCVEDQQSFSCHEKNSVELYSVLFEQHLEIQLDLKLGQLSAEALHSSIFGDYHPYREPNRRIRSSQSSHLFWWWDALFARDWNLFRTMLSDIHREESTRGIEYLVVELIRAHAPSDLICHLVRLIFTHTLSLSSDQHLSTTGTEGNLEIQLSI
jgi:hypothetical protein